MINVGVVISMRSKPPRGPSAGQGAGEDMLTTARTRSGKQSFAGQGMCLAARVAESGDAFDAQLIGNLTRSVAAESTVASR
jgi:hypothetical protein